MRLCYALDHRGSADLLPDVGAAAPASLVEAVGPGSGA